jgi:2-polyprenyl-3-methyl-5-hydroxy-6-metoxy-1,4-benzoquinol methylase
MMRPLVTDRALPPVPGTSADAFESLYARRPDPWGVLESPLAQQRHLALVETVGRHSPCTSILDVGCGEGALTRYLVGCATEVAGIDASRTAIRRARRLVPRATFHCCTLEAFSSDRLFDVVLAVEVLYYVQAVDVAIERLLALGRSVIVSYTNRERHRLEPYLEPYCPAEQRAFYPFFRLTGFGFTVARLVRPPKTNG